MRDRACQSSSAISWPAQIYKLARDNDWATKYRVLIGDDSDVPGDYSDMLSRSVFCLVATGELRGGEGEGELCGQGGQRDLAHAGVVVRDSDCNQTTNLSAPWRWAGVRFSPPPSPYATPASWSIRCACFRVRSHYRVRFMRGWARHVKCAVRLCTT